MPLSINQIPTPVPSSTDPANFSARGDAVFGAFPDFITQTNAVASEAAANRDSAEASKIAAAISETNAATYAANATTSSNNANTSSVAALWVSGTTYAINDKRVSPITGQVYRRKTAGAGTTDPSLDSTNWYAVLLDADTQYPSIKPTLNLDFANSGKLDPRITFTRASTATYYDGKTFAKAEENLLTSSQDFTAWGFFRATCTANVTVAPDGTTTADDVVDDANNSTHVVEQKFTGTVNPYTFSVYLKKNTLSWAQVFLYDGTATKARVNFDLTNGTVGTVSAGSGSITSVGNGWYRCVVTATMSTSTVCAAGVTLATGDTVSSYVGNGSGIYIWGAQLEQRSQVTAYTPTTTQPITKYQPVLRTASNNEPRFDYDPITLEAKGLLIEETRQNLVLRSENFENAVWTKTGATVVENTTTSPDGSIGADKLTEDATGGFHGILQGLSIAKNISYSFTVFVKQAGRSNVRLLLNAFSGSYLQADFDLDTGNVIQILNSGTASGATAVISNVGNGWFKCSISGIPSSASGTGLDAAIRLMNPSDGYTGDGFSGIYIWGAQLEAGAFATSYIPTTSTPVTRQADNAIMTGTNFSSWYNQNEGTIYSEAESSNVIGTATCIASFNNGTLAERIELYSGDQSHLFIVDNTVTQVNIDLGSFTKNKFSKVAAIYSLNNFAASLDSNIATDTSGTLPLVDRLHIGDWVNYSGKLNGHIKKLSYFPKAVQPYQLQILTK